MAVTTPDKAVFSVGDSEEWDRTEYELIYEDPFPDIHGNEYEHVTEALADEDFYQGLNMVTVIKRKSDGKLFGYFWWDDISKHGDAYIEPNGDEHGYESHSATDNEEDYDNYVSYYVFVPVEEFKITGYKEIDSTSK